MGSWDACSAIAGMASYVAGMSRMVGTCKTVLKGHECFHLQYDMEAVLQSRCSESGTCSPGCKDLYLPYYESCAAYRHNSSAV